METTVKKLLNAWNSHDFAQIAALYTVDCKGIDVGQAEMYRSIEGLRQIFASYWTAFPDLHFELEASIEATDALALFWQATGTHLGSIQNIPATGRSVQVRGSAHHFLSGGKITRSLYVWDTAGMLRSLGLLPELAA